MLVKFLEKSMTIENQGLPDFLRKWLRKCTFHVCKRTPCKIQRKSVKVRRKTVDTDSYLKSESAPRVSIGFLCTFAWDSHKSISSNVQNDFYLLDL